MSEQRGTEAGESRERGAVLVLEPLAPGLPWEVVEIAAPAEFFPRPDDAGFPDPASALHHAFELLTLMSEGRVPAMHEHVQQSVREFLRQLEERGFDRETALKLLMDVADRQASFPPKASRPARSPRRKAV
jgi:hypothetical protein